MSAIHLYQRLPSAHAIRLLQLGASEGTELCCTLHVHEIDSAPEFKALSYTWGPAYRDIHGNNNAQEAEPELLAMMTCNGLPMAITQNLYDALCSFKALGVTGWLWIDALCINQSDLGERMSQVLLMGKIYSCASEVLVWLGMDRPGFKDYFLATNEFLPKVLDMEEGIAVSGDINDSAFCETLGIVDPKARFVRIACFYASCRWFSRAWVVQEVLLARRVRVFCGNIEMSWNKMLQLCDVLRLFRWQQEIYATVVKLDGGESIRWFEELNAWRLLKTHYDRFDNKESVDDDHSFSCLFAILHHLRLSNCHDPRDKVYSALGIAGSRFVNVPIEHYIRPDYTIPVKEVFSTVAMHIFNHLRFLDMLATCRNHSGASPRPDLPSWVWDLTCLRAKGGTLHSLNSNFDAALCELLPRPTRQASLTSLTCFGARFATIHDVLESDLDQEWSKFRMDIVLRFCLTLPEKILCRRRLEVFWRTLIADTTEFGISPAPSEYEKRFYAYIVFQIAKRIVLEIRDGVHLEHEVMMLSSTLNQLETRDEGTELGRAAYVGSCITLLDKFLRDDDTAIQGTKHLALPFVQATTQASSGRRLFRTTEGYLGLGASTIRKGDEIWLLYDAHTPFVLRPTGKKSAFTIHGDCYVHDFMHGEMLDDSWGLKEKIGAIDIV